MCSECDFETYLDKADEMLEDDRFGYASNTVLGIREWVSEHEHITGKQKDALDNIYFSVT